MGLWDSIKSWASGLTKNASSEDNYLINYYQNTPTEQRGAVKNAILNSPTSNKSTLNTLSKQLDTAAVAADEAKTSLLAKLPSSVSASQVGNSVANLVELYARQQLGIETAYQYDQNVASAQQSLKALMAGYKDQARIPATAYGSNAYGDLATLDQYGFSCMVYTPTASWAEMIDAAITSGGQTIDLYMGIEAIHDTFDYWQVTNAEVLNDPDTRPQFVRNMMIDLLASGVTMWYVKDGDINNHYGNSYGLTNNQR